MTNLAVAGVREGEVLAGKYRVDRILGAGGMGVVVAAHHLGLDERVAIKFLLPEMTLGESVARFEREARAAVKIKSEHVARVSDVGTLENGAPYMVMEFLEGSDLSAWLRQQGRLSFEQAADFVLQASEAIAEAHALGIVHRDLKPANLFVIRRPDGSLSVKVLDFGISKMRGGSKSVPDVSITKTSAMMGSPLYMSPEQMQSAKDVDMRTDIWAIGIILYELVTGVSPFMADSMPELIAKILTTPPAPLQSHRPDAPAGFEAVILRCIERDRERRYESIGQLAAELLPFAPRRSRISLERISGVLRPVGLSATALVTPPSSDPTEPATGGAAPSGTQAAWGRTGAPTNRLSATLALAGTLALAAGGFLFWRASTSAAPGDVATPVTSPTSSADQSAVAATDVPAPGAPPTVSAPQPAAADAARSAAQAAATPTSAAPAAPPAKATAVRPPTRAVTSRAAPAPAAAAPPAASPAVKPAAPKPPGAFDDRK